MEAFVDFCLQYSWGFYVVGALALVYLVLKHTRPFIELIVSKTKTTKDDLVVSIVYKLIEMNRDKFEGVVDKAALAKKVRKAATKKVK